MKAILRAAAASAIIAITMCNAAGQAGEQGTVFTRAQLRSSYEERDGKLYVRLKLLPKSKIPFTTQTFRLPERSMLAQVPEGSWVKFTSKHVDGENVVTSIHAVPECVRFQPCD